MDKIKRRKAIYAVYYGKPDYETFIDLGTAGQLAKRLGCKLENIHYMACAKGKNYGADRYLVLKIGKEGDKEDE